MTAAFPAGTVARLHHLRVPVLNASGWAVMLAAHEADAVPEALLRSGTANFLGTHDPGVTWPDTAGLAGAVAALAAGGVVALVFPTARAAAACMRRVGEEVAR